MSARYDSMRVKLGLKKGNASPARRVTLSQAARAVHAAADKAFGEMLYINALRIVHACTRLHCSRPRSTRALGRNTMAALLA